MYTLWHYLRKLDEIYRKVTLYSLWAMGIECDAHNVADEPAGTWSEDGLNTLQA